MNQTKKFNLDFSIIVIFALGLLYILLPSNNGSIDSFAYASEIRDGQNLFRPHHLLYNALGYVLVRCLNISETLTFMQLINSLFTIGCLLIMRYILMHLTDKRTVAFVLLFLGSCYGFVRFAGDNETYILPLFFSLWASLALIKKQPIFVISLLAAIACLFHQIHFFWWFGLLCTVLLINRKKVIRAFSLFFVGALIVPIVYLLVFYFTEHGCPNIVEFVLYEYFNNETVNVSFKSHTLLLTPINFIRTFIQVHGYFYPLLSLYWYFGIPAVGAIICFVIAISKTKKLLIKLDSDNILNTIGLGHLAIFFLQLSFAIISDGNAEFMIMLPFALSIYLLTKYKIRPDFIKYSGIGLLIWNLSLGLIPYHFYTLDADIPMSNYMAQNPDYIYLPKNRVRITKILEYNHPQANIEILRLDKQTEASMDSLLQSGKTVITDILGSPQTLSRGTIVSHSNHSLFIKFNISEIAKIEYDLGTLKIHKISAKTNN